MHFCKFSLAENFSDLFFILLLLCRGGNNHVDVYLRRTGHIFFLREMEKTLSMSEKMDGEVFIYRQSLHFSVYG